MQYVRSITGSVSKGWNSINPATLSGAIDVIVVEQEDGSLACSPFHIRFGKFSLLRPYEKKVEFKVNGEKQDYPMKLGEGGEAFFVFETLESVPTEYQTSPVVSPAASPELKPSRPTTPTLQEPDAFSLNDRSDTPTQDALRQPPRGHSRSTTEGMPIPSFSRRAQSDMGQLTPLSSSPNEPVKRQTSGSFSGIENPHLHVPKLDRSESDTAIIAAKTAVKTSLDHSELLPSAMSDRDGSPLRKDLTRSDSELSVDQQEAKQRAMNLSKKLWTSNISNQVTESGDLMLDMAGFKGGNMEALQAEGIARQLLSEEVDGPYDIGALIGADEMGNIWIYGSEEAKEAANKRAAAATGLVGFNPAAYASTDAISDPGYHSDDARSDAKSDYAGTHIRRDSDSAVGMPSQPSSPVAGDPNKNYAKTLRLTSDQLKSMSLKSGANSMAFTVNRATCTATLWYWKHDVPIVISDIDGTITKSDVLGHVLNTIGRDWTHQGVAKLYTEIAANGYNFLYLTSRSVGQADTTRGYLKGVVQEGYKLPPGPVILSPDRTIAALRREVYLRKPEIFKMACLRDIMALFAGHGGSNNTHESVEAGLRQNPDLQNGLGTGKGKSGSPFYAGFGNRLTDALSYRSVNIPSTRIFTINSNSEVSLDLLSLNNYKTAYSTMREIVDHYFPPVGLLVKGGGEEFTDFNYWRDKPLDIVDFTDSEDEGDVPLVNALARVGTAGTRGSVLSEDEAGDLADSYLSDPRVSLDQSIAETLDDDEMTQSMLDDEELEGDDEEEYDDEDEEEEESEPEFELELEDSRGGAQSPAQKASQPSTPEMSSPPDTGRTPRQAKPDEQSNRVADKATGLGLTTLDQKSPKKR